MSTTASASTPLPLRIGQSVFRLFSSVGLAVVVLVFLLLLTYLGTEEQAEKGLFAVQEEYFKSWMLLHTFNFPVFGEVTLPLPGVMLLLTVFFLNLLCGGLIMLRKSKRTIGIFIGHFSMLFLLASGLLQYRYAKDGYLQLYEGETSGEFVSYHDWVIQVHELQDGEPDYSKKAVVVPSEALKEFDGSGEKIVESPDLPFKMRVSDYTPNGTVMPAAFRRDGEREVIDGMFLRKLPPEKENEANAAAYYIDVLDDSGKSVQRAILWGYENQPVTVNYQDRGYLLKLDRQRWQMPFEVQLDKFTYEFHPNTGVARVYKSDVTKIEGGDESAMVIEMNEPLRRKGYTLFQANWGPQENGRPVAGEPYSVFAVWRNPTSKLFLVPVEHWPFVAVCLAAVGMLIHFLLKLTRHLKPKTNATANPTTPVEA